MARTNIRHSEHATAPMFHESLPSKFVHVTIQAPPRVTPRVEQTFRNRAGSGLGWDAADVVDLNASPHDQPLDFVTNKDIASSDPFAWVCSFGLLMPQARQEVLILHKQVQRMLGCKAAQVPIGGYSWTFEHHR